MEKTNKTRITKAMRFEDIKAMLNGQPVTKQENEDYKALILEFLATLSDTSAGVTCTEIIKGVAEFEGFSTQKISPLVRQLMAADKVTKTEVKGKALFRLA